MEVEQVRPASSTGRVIQLMGAAGLLVMGVLLAAELGFSSLISGRVYPGVVAANIPLSLQTKRHAADILHDEVSGYRLNITVDDKRFGATASQVGARFDISGTLDQAFAVGRGHFLSLLGLVDVYGHKYQPINYSYTLNREILHNYVSTIVASVGTAPIDAKLMVSNGVGQVVADQDGKSVEANRLAHLVEASLVDGRSQAISVKPVALKADIVASEASSQITTVQTKTHIPITLSMNDQNFQPSVALIGSWLSTQKTGEAGNWHLNVVTDTSRIKDYVQDLADKLNVKPTNKKVTLKNGVASVEVEGVNGLAIDQDRIVSAINNALNTLGPLAMAIPTKVVAFKTETNQIITLDYGKYIEVNISQQHIYLYQDHNLMFDSLMTSGASSYGYGTPTGLFSIYYKTTNTRLRGGFYTPYYYDLPVSYWMPFNGQYGLHDGIWRNGHFGEMNYPTNGSHGCINLPLDTAAFIYGWSDVGTPVWVHL